MNQAALKITEPDTAKVRELNDAFRRDPYSPLLGIMNYTAGVGALSDTDRFALVDLVKEFEDFNEDNDPYGEHDFGKIEFHGEDYFFKIDYYDKALRFHSPDKSSPRLTTRVLTLMTAGEY